ncbi:hypothetical protein ACFOLA_12175 [Salinicoccus hispanicus]|uniref:Uncharacterized protein n=1 Tax=Salinicoccus hispanicus TaxID=157225 RepID=A0A6N8U0D8_9STAP|nr:hypothetical protein [Salinicoccus hispanicus]MXQ50767.1 hypothetical protein [Salinicoccus hispanicus]
MFKVYFENGRAILVDSNDGIEGSYNFDNDTLEMNLEGDKNRLDFVIEDIKLVEEDNYVGKFESFVAETEDQKNQLGTDLLNNRVKDNEGRYREVRLIKSDDQSIVDEE